LTSWPGGEGIKDIVTTVLKSVTMGGRRVVKNHEILGDVIYDDPLS